MSCIRFNTPAQRAAMREAPVVLSGEDAAALHLSPPVTESKLRRLRLLSGHADPKVREAVALNAHTPTDVMAALAVDPDAGVRGCVAKNEATDCDLLRRLAVDESEQVRSWVAVNFFVPDDAMAVLAEDSSARVRSLVAWKIDLAADAGARSV